MGFQLVFFFHFFSYLDERNNLLKKHRIQRILCLINFQETMTTLRTTASNVKLLICRPTSEQLPPLNRFVSTVS